MNGSRETPRRLVRVTGSVAAVGLAVTSLAFWFARADVQRLSARSVDRPGEEALLNVQQLTAAVDQVLATANGVVAASGLDRVRFARVLGPDVDASSALRGMALVAHEKKGVRTVARVGDVALLRGRERTVSNAATTAFIASRRVESTYLIGFAAQVAHDAAAVYLEVALPVDGKSAPFAMENAGRLVLANVSTTDGLVPWPHAVSFAGQSVTLYVAADKIPSGWLGLTIPSLTLVAGMLLTVLAALAAAVIVRRNHAVDALGTENRALDLALQHSRRIEGELRASREHLRTVLRNTPDSIVMLNRVTGACEPLNRSELLGYDAATLAETGSLDARVEPDSRVAADSFWNRLRELEAEQVCEATLGMTDAAQQVRYLRFRFSLVDADREADALLGVVADVTDEMANQLREEQLHEALRRSQRLESVGQLAGGIAHDFNNVLAAILACAELLEETVPSGRPREYAAEIRHSATRGTALIRQLLTFARRDDAQPRLVDLNTVVRDVEPMLERVLGEQAQLRITTTSCSCTLLADPVHLEQVIVNLAVNARDAMPDGGVLLISTDIRYDGEDHDDRVILSVSDTGAGIADEVRESLFDPFVTTKNPGEGTGLGLATVASIVNGLDGVIAVTSKQGQGTTFEISLPRQCVRVGDSAATGDDARFEGAGRRILLVEDDGAVRRALTHTLERNGFVVTAANQAADALTEIERTDFDLILTDTVMPAMSGLELAARVHLTRPGLPVVLMTGYSSDALDPNKHHEGQRILLHKPFTTAQLLDAMNAGLSITVSDLGSV
jgi:signal transduction histidine kinase/ActR/RegA family two-component response regulator